jgi:transglutaminase-like putative cysteine protease
MGFFSFDFYLFNFYSLNFYFLFFSFFLFIFTFLLFFHVTPVMAEEIPVAEIPTDWIYKANEARIRLNLSMPIDVVYTSDSRVESLEVKNSFFIRDCDSYEKSCLSRDSYPDSSMFPDDYVYSSDFVDINSISYFPVVPDISYSLDQSEMIYDLPVKESYGRDYIRKYSVGYFADLSVRPNHVIVKSKVHFPMTSKIVPGEYLKYMNPGMTIDSNDPDIVSLAQSLSSGIDDAFEVSYIFARWVNENINYSLDSMTSSVSEKASWVLLNRRGVCDEMTSLYIAMLRSVGIPARYVSGISYTNSNLFSSRWGFHGWAQVYLPPYGWVDFDPTYGEYGYSDLGHIALKYSVDSGESSVRSMLKSYDSRLITGSFNLFRYS